MSQVATTRTVAGRRKPAQFRISSNSRQRALNKANGPGGANGVNLGTAKQESYLASLGTVEQFWEPYQDRTTNSVIRGVMRLSPLSVQ